MTASLADALRGGHFIKWDDLGTGTVVSGTILGIDIRQATKYKTTELDFWKDGSPKMQAVFDLATTLRDPADPEDDGRRSMSVNLWSGQKKALGDACRAAGVREPKKGDEFSVVWLSGAGNADDPRVFAYRITPSSGVAAALADPFASAPAPAPAADPWASSQPTPAVTVPLAKPVAAPAPAPAAASKPEQAKELLRAGLSVEDVAAAVGYPVGVVAALANQL